MKKIVVLTGAGMSVESGLKTFRDADGLWEEYPVQKVATHEGWLNDPTLVTNFYNMLRKKCWGVKPNEGHKLVAELEKKYDVTVVTQNVDNLHEQAGSKKVIHLHGELMKVCSSTDPDNPRYQQTLTPENCEIEPGTKAATALCCDLSSYSLAKQYLTSLLLLRSARQPISSSSSVRHLTYILLLVFSITFVQVFPFI